MAKLKVNKTEAARRQVDAAIRMLFRNEDPVAIYTLAGASLRILRDIAAKRSDSYMHDITNLMVKPGMEKEFWRQWHAPANFLKHADKDPDAILENIDEEANEGTLCMASLFYQDLGHQFTPEMSTLVGWYMAIHPEFIRDDAPPLYKKLAVQSGAFLRKKSRPEQLAHGLWLLQLAKDQPRRF